MFEGGGISSCQKGTRSMGWVEGGRKIWLDRGGGDGGGCAMRER